MRGLIALFLMMLMVAPAIAQDDYLLKDYARDALSPSTQTYDDGLDNSEQPETKTPLEDHVIDEPVTLKTFHGYPCTQDCSGHKAGYAWAKKKNIETQDDCGGNSNSFSEGCKAYVKENGFTLNR